MLWNIEKNRSGSPEIISSKREKYSDGQPWSQTASPYSVPCSPSCSLHWPSCSGGPQSHRLSDLPGWCSCRQSSLELSARLASSGDWGVEAADRYVYRPRRRPVAHLSCAPPPQPAPGRAEIREQRSLRNWHLGDSRNSFFLICGCPFWKLSFTKFVTFSVLPVLIGYRSGLTHAFLFYFLKCSAVQFKFIDTIHVTSWMVSMNPKIHLCVYGCRVSGNCFKRSIAVE